MPTYEYECSECQNRFDLRQSFADPPEASCPRCGSAARRRLTAPAIVFKGTGWYSTDHRPSSFESKQDTASDTASAAKTPEPAVEAPKTEAAVEGS